MLAISKCATKASWNFFVKYSFKFNFKPFSQYAILYNAAAFSFVPSFRHLHCLNYAAPSCISKVTFCSASMNSASLTCEEQWKALEDYYCKNKDNLVLKELFKDDPERFNTFRYFIILIFPPMIHLKFMTLFQ